MTGNLVWWYTETVQQNMAFSIKTKIWNGSFFVFLLITLFSFGALVVANEQEAITTYFEDADQDGLSAEEEKAFGTDPTNSDTDGDGYSDGVEIESGYDPLKPAPGDRIVPEETAVEPVASDVPNLTDIASDELTALVTEKQESQEELTAEDLNEAVAKVLENANEEVVLPEVDVDKIKIKELSDKLDETEKKLKQKEDTLEYLTTISYIILSNAPVPIRSENELTSFTEKSIQGIMTGLMTGNYEMLSSFDLRTKTILEEIDAVEVPENMVATHIKAKQLVGFMAGLSDKIKKVDPLKDPIGQMYELAKVQGAMLKVQEFVSDTQGTMTDLGIKGIPLDI